MYRDEIYVDQILWMRHPKTGLKELVRVLRVNPKNIKAETQNGTVWSVHPTFLSLADSDDVARFTVLAPGAQLTLGAVVQFKEGSFYAKKFPQYTNLVVIGHKDMFWSTAPLGGDGGVYFSKCTADDLVVQPVTVVE